MRRGFALLAILCLVVAGSALARPSDTYKASQELLPGQTDLQQSQQMLRQLADTTWFGGYNAAEQQTYNSVDDGYDTAVWTWDAGTADPLEGWTSYDLTQDLRVYFSRVIADSFIVHGDPYVPMIDGDVGQIWVGAHEDEANNLGWVLGMGYGNNWCQLATSPQYAISSGQDVQISFQYFQDSEIEFDYTYINILCYNGATLNQTFEVARLDARHGTYLVPENFLQTVPYGSFTQPLTAVKLQFNFKADGGWSDEDGDYSCDYGPFAADDINFRIGGGDHIYDFETTADGWTFARCPGIGTYTNVCTEAQWGAWIVGPPAVRCPCDLSGNAIYCATVVPFSPRPGHFQGHEEYMISPIVDRERFTSANGWFNVIVRYDAFYFLRISAGTFFRPGFFYYPFVTEEDPTPRWSPRAGQDVWRYTGQTPFCAHNWIHGLTVPPDGDGLPYTWEQLKYTFQVTTDCASFAIPATDCRNEGKTNGSPVWDNVRIGITGGVNAPAIVLATGQLFHDGFGQTIPSFLDPGDVCNVDAAYDRSRDNTDYNDWLYDTTRVMGPPVFVPQYTYWIDLCFKVATKGARQDMIPGYSAWKSRLVGDPEVGFVCAVMDTAEIDQGGVMTPVENGQARLSFFHENDPGFDPNYAERTAQQEILPDLVFTPGTRIEYYYRSYWAQNPQGYFTIPTQAPDVNVYEIEMLPMMELDTNTPAEYDCIWPSVLFIDAFNGGSETYIIPLLEQEGIAFDKFDRQNFSSNYDAPMLRSFGGTLYNPGGYGNNGCTVEQLLGYRMILLNSGTLGIGSGEEPDFEMLEAWLTTTDCGLTDTRRGLILNGNTIAEIMAEPTEGIAILFCNNVLGTLLTNHAYREYNNDDFGCVYITPTGAEFSPLADISVFNNDCPSIHAFNVLAAGSGGVGNMNFTPGSGSVAPTYPVVNYSQIVKENIIGGDGGYKTIVDGFSLHDLSEIGYGGEECSKDTLAIIAGCADLFGPEIDWMLEGGAAPFAKWRYPCTDVSVDDGSDTHVGGPVNYLYPSRPNPFRASATIRFALAADGPVKIAVYDVSGRMIRTLHDGNAKGGENTLTWDGTDNAGNPVSGGIFWMEMSTPSYTSSKRLVVLR